MTYESSQPVTEPEDARACELYVRLRAMENNSDYPPETRMVFRECRIALAAVSAREPDVKAQRDSLLRRVEAAVRLVDPASKVFAVLSAGVPEREPRASVVVGDFERVILYFKPDERERIERARLVLGESVEDFIAGAAHEHALRVFAEFGRDAAAPQAATPSAVSVDEMTDADLDGLATRGFQDDDEETRQRTVKVMRENLRDVINFTPFAFVRKAALAAAPVAGAARNCTSRRCGRWGEKMYHAQECKLHVSAPAPASPVLDDETRKALSAFLSDWRLLINFVSPKLRRALQPRIDALSALASRAEPETAAQPYRCGEPGCAAAGSATHVSGCKNTGLPKAVHAPIARNEVYCACGSRWSEYCEQRWNEAKSAPKVAEGERNGR
jgi:hypothetical protein